MHCIIKLHGTSGSGKTTVARGLMEGMVVEPILHPANRKHMAYKVNRPEMTTPLFILGPYTAICGGLDSLSNVEDHIALLQEYAEHGHVFYEGLLGSEYYGRIGAVSEQWGDNHIFAFLDTPIETCIERIKARRLARGNIKPLNEANTRGRIAKIERLKYRLHHELKRKTVTINHTKAVENILEIYHAFDRQ